LNKNIRLLGFGAGVRLFGAAMVYPFLSLYLKNVARLGYAEIGALIVLIAIVPLAVSPFGGLIADRAGRRRVFISGLGGEAASVLLISLSMADNWVPGVLLGGALAGLAGSVAQPAVQAYVADMTQLSDRTLAYTWVRIGFNAGFTVGVALGGVLIGFLGFPDTGLLATGILAISTLFLLVSLDPSPYDNALASGKMPDGASLSRPSSIRESVKVLGRDRTFLVLCLASLFAGMVYGHWSTTFPLFANTILFVPYAILALALALNGVIVIFGQTLTTRLMTGRRHTSSAVLAVVMMGLSFLVLGGISLISGGALVAVFAFVVLLTIGENLGAIPSMTLASNVAPATEIGSYNGVFGLFSGIGNSISPLIGGIVLSTFVNPLAVWLILALPCVPAIILFRWVGTRIPKAANTV
jgi:MFS family permease